MGRVKADSWVAYTYTGTGRKDYVIPHSLSGPLIIVWPDNIDWMPPSETVASAQDFFKLQFEVPVSGQEFRNLVNALEEEEEPIDIMKAVRDFCR